MIAKVLLLALLAAAATASPVNLDASTVNYGDAINKFITAWKTMSPCGYAADNIPVMAPLTNDFSNFNYSMGDTSIVGNASNIRITGLNRFQVLSGSYDASTQQAKFDIIFPEIQVLGSYELEGVIDIYGILIPTRQAALINDILQQLRFVGSYTFAPSQTNANGLRISQYHLQFYLGNVELYNWDTLWDISSNDLSNRASSQLISFLAQHIQPSVDRLLGKYVMPAVNDMLSTMSMSQLIQLLVDTANNWNSASCDVQA
ncbi:hypothetical protein KR222_004981 [Zaprionus bogoriensis]|nr:hypothetical protein KR222_004981 [Zaprionus bogoriensis]